MSLSEEDIQLIETSLDASVSEDEAADLRDRLERDPALAVATEDLRVQRAARRSIWAALEPTDAEVDHLIHRVTSATAAAVGRQRTHRFIRPLRIAAAVAACVALSFAAGWKLHTHRLAATGTPHVAP